MRSVLLWLRGLPQGKDWVRAMLAKRESPRIRLTGDAANERFEEINYTPSIDPDIESEEAWLKHLEHITSGASRRQP